MRVRSNVLVRATSLALGLALLSMSVGPANARVARAGLLTVPVSTIYLSPDHDSRGDVARVPFRLARPAGVVVRVLTSHATVALETVRLGRLAAGPHQWTWDGRTDDGSVIADGTYRVQVTARGLGGNVDRRSLVAIVDTDSDRGRLITSRSTVYPLATVVADRVLITYLRENWNATEATYPNEYQHVYGPRIPIGVRVVITDAEGHQVWSTHRPGGLTTAIAWDGRNSRGKVVPAGTYTAHLRVSDAAGNRTTRVARLRVSHRQLAAETFTATLAPGSTVRTTRPTPPGCNGCSDGCPPVDSVRFPGGLSFPPCPGTGGPVSDSASFALPVPFAAAPVDSYRVTASGGPTAPGGSGAGTLAAGSGTPVGLGPGDATATTGWTGVELDRDPYLPHQDLAASWEFVTYGGYDLASFVVEYRHYVPVP